MSSNKTRVGILATAVLLLVPPAQWAQAQTIYLRSGESAANLTLSYARSDADVTSYAFGIGYTALGMFAGSIAIGRATHAEGDIDDRMQGIFGLEIHPLREIKELPLQPMVFGGARGFLMAQPGSTGGQFEDDRRSDWTGFAGLGCYARFEVSPRWCVIPVAEYSHDIGTNSASSSFVGFGVSGRFARKGGFGVTPGFGSTGGDSMFSVSLSIFQ